MFLTVNWSVKIAQALATLFWIAQSWMDFKLRKKQKHELIRRLTIRHGVICSSYWGPRNDERLVHTYRLSSRSHSAWLLAQKRDLLCNGHSMMHKSSDDSESRIFHGIRFTNQGAGSLEEIVLRMLTVSLLYGFGVGTTKTCDWGRFDGSFACSPKSLSYLASWPSLCFASRTINSPKHPFFRCRSGVSVIRDKNYVPRISSDIAIARQ